MSTPFTSFRLSYKLFFLISLFLSVELLGQSTDSTVTIAQRRTIQSKILGEKRTLYIHTPSKMRVNETYPVMYLLDGEAFIEMAGGQVRYLSESYRIAPSMII